ncbi:MAG TPA: DUF1707 and DUF4190 domain-containing protein [Streptosporangiaceae bacterium]|jgi:hypothetical protein
MGDGPGYAGQPPDRGWAGQGRPAPGYGQGAGYGPPGYPAGYPATYSRAQLRVSDADRDWVTEYLKVAFTDGRLTKEDHDLRVGRALASKTYADLDAIMADLHVPRPMPMPRPPTNQLAIASLACGLGQFLLGPIPTIPAIVLGHVARHQIRRTGEDGAGLALAGLLLGWAAVTFAAIALVAFLALAVTVVQGPGG